MFIINVLYAPLQFSYELLFVTLWMEPWALASEFSLSYIPSLHEL